MVEEERAIDVHIPMEGYEVLVEETNFELMHKLTEAQKKIEELEAEVKWLKQRLAVRVEW